MAQHRNRGLSCLTSQAPQLGVQGCPSFPQLIINRTMSSGQIDSHLLSRASPRGGIGEGGRVALVHCVLCRDTDALSIIRSNYEGEERACAGENKCLLRSFSNMLVRNQTAQLRKHEARAAVHTTSTAELN